VIYYKKINKIIKEETEKLYSEEFGVETKPWDELNDSTQVDILENIYHSSPYLENNWNIWTFKEYLDDATDLPEFRIDEKNVNEVYEEMKKKGWGISDLALKKLLQKIKSNEVIDPIILKDDKFYDGGHRVLAFKKLNKETIPTIDIGEHLKINWEDWLTT